MTLVFLSPMAASATVTYNDSLNGYEYCATSTEGRFAGQAGGALPGAWAATVDHTPLSPDATVTGGSFSLATVLNGSAVRVSGGVSGGSVTTVRSSTTGTACSVIALRTRRRSPAR